jgi:hypothetical protein
MALQILRPQMLWHAILTATHIWKHVANMPYWPLCWLPQQGSVLGIEKSGSPGRFYRGFVQLNGFFVRRELLTHFQRTFEGGRNCLPERGRISTGVPWCCTP